MQYLQTEEPAHSDGRTTSSIIDEDARIESLNIVLTEWFHQHQDMHCFLAVDPSRRDPSTSDTDDSGAFVNLSRADVIINHDAFPEAHRPYLLELDLSTQAGVDALTQSVRMAFEDRRPASMAEGLGQRIGGWLAASASLNEIAAHWSRLALQHDECGRACVLRFYDSRALALIWPTLSYTQQQTMLGPVRAWHILDASARPDILVALINSCESFTLSAAQWHAIHQHGVINRALALHARAYGRQPESGEIEVAAAAAMRTDRYGLIDQEDQVAFVTHALAWHPQFDLHPKVARLLAHKEMGDFYTGEVVQLSNDEIEEIRQGSWYECLDDKADH